MILLHVVTVGLIFTSVCAQDLTREKALEIGSENGGVRNGSFWFEHGDSSPPFVHAGHMVISRGSQISLTLNDGVTSGLRVGAPYTDGSQTRLDFFTSSKNRGWVAAHVLKPEINSSRPKPLRDERPNTHKALCSAAELAIHESDLKFLILLLKRGLQVNEALNFEDGDTLLHEAALYRKLDIIKYLRQNGADPTIRNCHGVRPIDDSIRSKEKDLCALLEKSEGKEIMIDRIPSGLVEAVLPHRSINEIFFVSWNGQDPPPELLAEIRKTVPKARPASRMQTLDRRPLGAHSWYQDKKNKEFGSLIEVSLNKAGEEWTVSVRRTVGPAMAGGGWEGKAGKEYGYWYTYGVNGWVE